MDIIAQLGSLAQRPDFENWTDLLVLLVMGGLWVVGMLAKAWSAKRTAQRNEQENSGQRQSPRVGTWQERLAQKVEEIQRSAQARSAEMARRLEQKTGLPAGGGHTPPARAPGGKITVRQGPRGESILVYERPEPQPVAPPEPPARPPAQPPRPVRVAAPAPVREPATLPPNIGSQSPAKSILSSLPSVALKTSDLSGLDAAQTKSPRPSADPELSTIIDSGDPDALRKAILHYEILGRPLAFRDLGE
jgi:hypothetical protein